MVSVVMPVYNTGEYLEDSIGSVLHQKYQDIELILIDDFSDEKTKRKLNEYSNIDKRVRLFHADTHIGPAKARNWGISLSRGDYLLFLDSDDYFENDLIQTCYLTAERFNSDVVVFNYAHSDTEHLHEVIYCNRPESFYAKYAMQVFDFCEYDNSEVFLYAFATGTKFFNRKFIVNNGILFQDIRRQNDIYFSLISMLHAKRVIFVDDDKVLLHARDHELKDRISNVPLPFCGYQAICKVLEQTVKEGKSDRYSKLISRAVVNIILHGFMQCKDFDDKGEEYYNFIRTEGIENIDILLNVNANKVSIFYMGLKKAMALEYRTKWWIEYDYFWVLRMCGNYKVIDLISKSNGRIAFWGVGIRGRFLLSLLLLWGIHISMVVDKGKDIQGKNIEGYMVEDPQKAIKNCEIIITGNKTVVEYITHDYVSDNCKVILWEPSDE